MRVCEEYIYETSGARVTRESFRRLFAIKVRNDCRDGERKISMPF